LFEQLKKLRNKIAHEENVPAYIIFSDSSLLDLATYLPLEQKDLHHISGFGAVKIEKYGAPFLEVVQDYCIQHQLSSQIHQKQPKREKKTTSTNRPSETKRVTFELYQQGKSIPDIAAERNLSIMTIEEHLSYYIGKGELEVSEFVNAVKRTTIQKAADVYGITSLKKLKENLPEDISYAEIKFTIAALKNESV
jgi:ATP-dependent DNA helicase RecQ